MSYFLKVKAFAEELGLNISYENPKEGILRVSDENRGLFETILDCEEGGLLVIEQFLLKMNAEDPAVMRYLLHANRTLVHGAFCFDENNGLLFRDTLQLDNLDLNELEASLNALGLALAEHARMLMRVAN
jgi:hypothetical protein